MCKALYVFGRAGFDCLGDGNVQVLTLAFQQRLVYNLLRDVVLEDIDQPRLLCFDAGEVAFLQHRELGF